jgi:ATP-dependent Clp protease ATP-binding subunit ClpX
MSNQETGTGGTRRNRNAYCSFCRKNYREVGPLVEGPGEVYICGECIDLCQSIIEQEKRRRGGARSPSLPAPDDIRACLDQLAVGEHQAQEAVLGAALRHYEHSGTGPPRPVLLVGPTRSSKVFQSRALAHALAVPFAEGDGLTLVRSGQAEIDLLHRLLLAGDFGLETAQRGVVYVDGVDDPATQKWLLQLWEGRGGDSLWDRVQVDVTRLLFICGGVFAGLDAVIARLGRHPEQPIAPEALLALGMAPEMVRQLAVVVRVAPLDERTLGRIVSWVDLDRMASGEV